MTVQLPAGETELFGTANPDAFVGTSGDTAVSYENATAGVDAYLSGGNAATGYATGDTYQNIQDLVGSNFDDYLSGNGKNNSLYGGDGNDSLYGFASSATSVTHLYGGNGVDTLLGGVGIDIMDGGAGENTVSYFLDTSGGVTVSLANQNLNTGWAAGDVYTNLQDVIGTTFNDIIYGGSNGLLNQLQGEGGNDVIYGGSGYNVLIGGAGADELHGAGTGNLVDYETATTGVTASLLNPSINTGDAAGDTYVNLQGADLAGSPFDDILHGDNSNNNIVGDPDISVYHHAGNDQLFGEGGDDTLDGGPGADHLDGGTGFNYAAYNDATVGVHASLLDPTTNTGDAAGDTYANIQGMLGSAFDDVLAGDSGDNTLFGEAGNDTLVGNDGNDTLEGGAGADHLDGGAGFNTASYGTATTGVTASLVNPSQNTGDAAGDTYVNIQAILGSNFNDVLTGDANSNVIQGGAGDDVITGGGGNDILIGGDGNDVIIAGPGIGDLTGGAGADTFKFNEVADSQSTAQIAPTKIEDFQTGVDKIDITALNAQSVNIVQQNGFYDLVAVTASGTFTLESVNAFTMSDVITSVVGQTLTGTSSPDTLTGGSGADVIIGGGGGDSLTGGGGPDTFKYVAASDSTAQGYDIIQDFQRGVDVIDLSAVAPTYISLVHSGGATYLFPSTPGGNMEIAVIGDVEGPDILTSSPVNLYLVADDNGDTLIGGTANDSLHGGAGNDVIIGGGAADALFGGAGSDTFKYVAVSDSTPQAYDIIQDFQTGTDKLDLTALNPTNVSILHYNGGTFISGVGSNGQAFQIGSVHDINAPDIEGLTSGAYIVGDSLGDTLVGGSFGETIVGGSGNDVIIGGGGADALYGGAGADTFKYLSPAESTPQAYDIIQDFQTGSDKLDLSALGPTDVSIVHYNGGTFISGIGANNEVFQIASIHDINAPDIIGLASGAYIVGDTLGDALIGGNFAETIVGGSGNDTIIGGGGADALYGGGGADTFKYLAVSDSTPSAPDIIQDFQTGVDKVDLTAIHTGSGDQFNLISDAHASYLFVELAGHTTNDMEILFTTPNVHMSDIVW